MTFINNEAAEALAAAQEITKEGAAPEKDKAKAVLQEKSIAVSLAGEMGLCLVTGVQYLGHKEIEHLAMVVNHEGALVDRAVRSILFTEEELYIEDKAVVGLTSYPCQAVAMSLTHLWERVLRECREEDNVSLLAAWHYELLTIMGHELVHIQFEDNLDEETADFAGRTILWDLAKKYDMEPDAWLSIPFLAEKIQELLFGKEGEQGEWADKQRYMLENGLTYFRELSDEWKELKVPTFKTFCQINSADRDDEKWENSPVPGDAWSKLIREIDPPVKLEVPPTSAGNPEWDALQTEEYDEYEGIMRAAAEWEVSQQNLIRSQRDLAYTLPVEVGAQPQLANTINVPNVPSTPAIQTGEFVPASVPTTQVPQDAGVGTLPDMGDTAPIGILAEVAKPIIEGLYAKMYNHIYANCGRMLNSDVGFSKPEAVYQTIELTPEERKVIAAFTTNAMDDPSGQEQTVMMDNSVPGLKGMVSKNIKIPGYKVVFQCDMANPTTGQLQKVFIRRWCCPQNVNTSSRSAAKCKTGEASIMYAYEDTPSLKVDNNNIRYRIYNGTGKAFS